MLFLIGVGCAPVSELVGESGGWMSLFPTHHLDPDGWYDGLSSINRLDTPIPVHYILLAHIKFLIYVWGVLVKLLHYTCWLTLKCLICLDPHTQEEATHGAVKDLMTSKILFYVILSPISACPSCNVPTSSPRSSQYRSQLYNQRPQPIPFKDSMRFPCECNACSLKPVPAFVNLVLRTPNPYLSTVF